MASHRQRLPLPLCLSKAPSLLLRFLSFVEPRDKKQCWEWTGTKDRKGYGRIKLGPELEDHKRSSVAAHRVSYALFIAAIEETDYLDHLCRNPSCVNPHHLECVSIQENTRRQHASSTEAPF